MKKLTVTEDRQFELFKTIFGALIQADPERARVDPKGLASNAGTMVDAAVEELQK